MRRKMFLKILVLVLGLIFGFCASFCFAQEESITITTYYPSPYGSYNELSTNKLAVGYTTSDEQPEQVGDIRLKHWTTVPSTESGKAGEVAYASDDFLYVHNGSSWVKQGGGGGIIGAQDGYAGQTGTQACAAIGKTCSRVISYNFIKEDVACPGATHCMRVCMTWYNQSLPGVEDGMDGGSKDNIHSCNARLGEYTTYLHAGVVRCNAYFSAVCN